MTDQIEKGEILVLASFASAGNAVMTEKDATEWGLTSTGKTEKLRLALAENGETVRSNVLHVYPVFA